MIRMELVTTEELYERIFQLEGEKRDLEGEIEHLKEEIRDLIQERDEYYRPIPIDYGVSDRDFV